MAIKAVIFDLDGVVVDSEAYHKKSMDAVIEAHGIAMTKEDQEVIEAHCRGRRVIDIWIYLKDYYHLEETAEQLLNQSDVIFLDLVITTIELMHGFEKVVKQLRGNYKLALTTSGHSRYMATLEKKFALSNYFDLIITGDHITKGKPDPEPYLLTCKELEIKPKDAVVIEDTINGIKSAKAAGCHCIAVSFTFPKNQLREADFIVDSFAEAEKIIGDL